MNVLLTGAFGNIGQSALDELLERGHTVRCFDLRQKRMSVSLDPMSRERRSSGGIYAGQRI